MLHFVFGALFLASLTSNLEFFPKNNERKLNIFLCLKFLVRSLDV